MNTVMKQLQIIVPAALVIEKVEAIPLVHAEHGGEIAVCVKNNRGIESWGFGETQQLAADEAVAAFNGDFE